MGIIVDAIASDNHLWECYLRDFIALRWKLEQQKDIAEQLLYKYFDQLCGNEDNNNIIILKRLVILHCHANVQHLALAQMATSLHPLEVIKFTIAVASANTIKI